MMTGYLQLRYNAGPNRILKEIKKNKAKGLPTDFWSLKLPKETKAYVPKLLALLEVIKNPDKFSVVIPNLPIDLIFNWLPCHLK